MYSNLKKVIALALTAWMVAGSMTAYASSSSNTKKYKYISYVSLNIDTDMEEGMAVGNEDIEVTPKSSYVKVKQVVMTSRNTDDNNDEDDEGLDDGTWTEGDRPEYEITLEVDNTDKYRFSLSNSDSVNLTGNADPAYISSSGSKSTTATIKIRLDVLYTGAYALRDAYYDDAGYYLNLGSTPNYCYHEIKVYRNKKYVNTYETGYGEEAFNMAKAVTETGTYTAYARIINKNTQSVSQWVEIDGALNIHSDDLKNIKNDSAITTSVGSGEYHGTWMHNSVGWWWKDDAGTYPANAWRKVNNIWYYFDNAGYMVKGLQNINDKIYMFDDSGAMRTGWYKIKGNWYMFDWTNGNMLFGWQLAKDNSKWYYLDQRDGHLHTNETIDGYIIGPTGSVTGTSTTISSDNAGSNSTGSSASVTKQYTSSSSSKGPGHTKETITNGTDSEKQALITDIYNAIMNQIYQ